jgi:hypothetical protein
VINSQATSVTGLTPHLSAIVACFVFWREICHPAFSDFCNTIGTLLPRANAAASPQLAKADFASSSQHVREGQRIAALDAEVMR